MIRIQQLRSPKLQAQATLNFIYAAYLVKNVTAHHWIEVNKKPLLLFQIKRQQNWINLIIVYNIREGENFCSVFSAVRIPDPKAQKC